MLPSTKQEGIILEIIDRIIRYLITERFIVCKGQRQMFRTNVHIKSLPLYLRSVEKTYVCAKFNSQNVLNKSSDKTGN